jgi:diguanylate cyclase (GGDEF)-like protein
MSLLLLLWYASIHGSYDNIKRYKLLNILAIGHVIFDIITVITVNNLDTVPPLVNRICHVIFYYFAILYCYVLLDFVVEIIYGERSRNGRIIGQVTLAGYMIIMLFLPIEYVKGRGTNYSFGPCVIAGYAFAAILFLISLTLIIIHKNKRSGHDRRVLIPSFLLMLLAMIIQIKVPELLFTGADITLVTAAMFIGVIDPVGKFRHKAYYDLLTGLRNQNCYEDDMADLRRELGRTAHRRNFIYVACDVNGLKQVNDDLGHAAGDDYIRTAARALKDSLGNSYAVYRKGGDEFCAIYLDKPTETAKADVARLRKAFGTSRALGGVKPGTSIKYGFSIGYAAAMRGEDIMETAKRADATMMEEKRRYYLENGIDRRRTHV